MRLGSEDSQVLPSKLSVGNFEESGVPFELSVSRAKAEDSGGYCCRWRRLRKGRWRCGYGEKVSGSGKAGSRQCGTPLKREESGREVAASRREEIKGVAEGVFASACGKSRSGYIRRRLRRQRVLCRTCNGSRLVECRSGIAGRAWWPRA